MNDYQRYYVYMHIDPRDGKVHYVGMGSAGRAWQIRHSAGPGQQYGQRSAEHFAWFQELEREGYTLADMVVIVEQAMSKEDALEFEADLIKQHGTDLTFNLQGTGKYLGNVPEDVRDFAKSLHKMGYGYQRVAYLLGADDPKQKVMSAKRMILSAN